MKVSLAVALLIGNISAQQDSAVAVASAQPMYNSTYEAKVIDDNLSRDARMITRAIDDLQRQIPEGPVSGKVSYNVNTAPIKSSLELQKEFYKTDFAVVENAVQEVMGTPLQNAKLQIATQFAGVTKSTFDALQTQMQYLPNGDKCQSRQFYDCLQGLKSWERRGPRIFGTQCAQDSGCGFGAGPDMAPQDQQNQMQAAQGKWGQLAMSVAGEFNEVARKQGQIIDGVGNKWMNKSAAWMKSDMKCDAGCVDQYVSRRNWPDYNEFDLMTRCPCEIPIQVAPVQDFEGKDFYKMTTAEHLTNLADGAAATPPATAPAGESDADKAKRIAKEKLAQAKAKAQEGVDKLNEASGGNAMYIIGGVAVVCLGGVAYYFCSKKEDDSEGGQDDRFSTLL